jgi:DNA repair exonuclease SbcCD ATPase subunit
METEFNQLLQTSKSVDEKLQQVTASDDTLQAMQVKIHHLDEAMTQTEERYQRIERKNQVLEETNSGIERNFKALQDTEEEGKALGDNLTKLSVDLDTMKAMVEQLAAGSEKAQAVTEKLTTLDETLADLDQRIQAMQQAREWLARLETRLNETYKEAHGMVELAGNIIRRDEAKNTETKGAPPLSVRDNVIRLAHSGWKTAEIARACKISQAEVELILEMAPKD